MSITITLSNSICQLSGHKKSLDKRLKTVLSYKDQNVEFSLFKNSKELNKLEAMLENGRFSNKEGLEKRVKQLRHIVEGLERKLFISLYKDGEFPTGLLYKVLECLDYSKLQYEIKDLRKKPKKQHKFVLKNSLPQLRYYQKEAAKRLESEGRGIVVMPTGGGKTVSICKMIWDLGVNTLIITPNKSITDMMYDTVVHFFGKGKVSRLNTKSKKINKINIVNYQALIKLSPSLLKGIDAVFIDEFHHSASASIREINLKHLKNVYFRIGLTATNFRNSGDGIALESVLSKVLYEYEVKQAIEDGYLVKPEFIIIDNYVQDEKTWQTTYKTQIVENKSRNADIVDIAKEHSKDQVLILVQQVEHGEILSKKLGCDFLHGQVKDSDRQRIMENFRKKKIKCLVGTRGVLGEGIDLPCAEVLIMAAGGKARSEHMQALGRVLRIYPGKEKAIIYDFADNGSRWLHNHFLERMEVNKIY